MSTSWFIPSGACAESFDGIDERSGTLRSSMYGTRLRARIRTQRCEAGLGGKTKHVVSPRAHYIPPSPLSTRLVAALLHPSSPPEHGGVTHSKSRGKYSQSAWQVEASPSNEKGRPGPGPLGLIIQEYLLIEAHGRGGGGAPKHASIHSNRLWYGIWGNFPCTRTRTCISVPNVVDALRRRLLGGSQRPAKMQRRFLPLWIRVWVQTRPSACDRTITLAMTSHSYPGLALGLDIGLWCRISPGTMDEVVYETRLHGERQGHLLHQTWKHYSASSSGNQNVHGERGRGSSFGGTNVNFPGTSRAVNTGHPFPDQPPIEPWTSSAPFSSAYQPGLRSATASRGHFTLRVTGRIWEWTPAFIGAGMDIDPSYSFLGGARFGTCLGFPSWAIIEPVVVYTGVVTFGLGTSFANVGCDANPSIHDAIRTTNSPVINEIGCARAETHAALDVGPGVTVERHHQLCRDGRPASPKCLDDFGGKYVSSRAWYLTTGQSCSSSKWELLYALSGTLANQIPQRLLDPSAGAVETSLDDKFWYQPNKGANFESGLHVHA
ncbi:hypothetical protein HD554DRAFT_2040590 [Boletus coccyginus]|nr:hypothetical protein HD554DRAFT_2040590 [Boletus coccyginus]